MKLSELELLLIEATELLKLWNISVSNDIKDARWVDTEYNDITGPLYTKPKLFLTPKQILQGKTIIFLKKVQEHV